jgi:hypothetical protein
MTAAELREYWHRSPFVPFEIVVPGRKKIRVPHPDFLSISPSGQIAHVWKTDDSGASLDIFLITAIETSSRASKQKRSRKKQH